MHFIVSVTVRREATQLCLRPRVLVPRPGGRALCHPGPGLHRPRPGRGEERLRRLQCLRVRVRADRQRQDPHHDGQRE